MRLALAKLSAFTIALGCLQCGFNDVSSCSSICLPFQSGDVVQFSPPLTLPGAYTLDLKDPSGAVDVSCSFSLPCSASSLNRCINKKGGNGSSAAVQCSSPTPGSGQISGIASISSSFSSASLPDGLSISLTRDGSIIASESFSAQPHFEIRQQCGCSNSTQQAWVVEISSP